MWRLLRITLLASIAWTGVAYAGEDQALATGRRLMTENDCNGACHQKHAPNGDAASLYTRPNAKVKNLPALRKQVQRCVASVGAQIMPDEIDAVVAALNHDYYKFK
jgi:hypothetical protein